MPDLYSLSKVLAITCLCALFAPCDTLTITISGTGTGDWNRDFFVNKAFQFTFFTPDTANIGTAPCCSGILTTPKGTLGSVTIDGVGEDAMGANGDQAVFVNPGASAAGIWHYNSPEFLTVYNSALSHYNLTDTIAPVTGTTFAYTIPLVMSNGNRLYFTSVSNLSFSVQRGPAGGKPGVVSVSPDSSTTIPDVSNLFTFTVSDAAGVGDLQGLNILFSDPPHSDDAPAQYSDAYACWLWYQRSTKTLSLFLPAFGGWPSAPLGAEGSVLTSDRCSVDTTTATVTESGNFLTLTLPIRLTADPNNPQVYPSPMSIAVRAVNNENVDTGYQHAGQVTLNPGTTPGFVFYTTPTIQDVALGTSAAFKLNVVSWGGFNDVITFSANVPMDNAQYTFDPPTITGSGETTLTVSTKPLIGKPYPGPTNGTYLITAFARSSAVEFDRAVLMAVEAGPPTISVSDSYPASGPDHQYHFTVTDPPWWLSQMTGINAFNALIGPSLDGRNACWLYFDGKYVWLANDDGVTWSFAGPGLTTPAGNSQCTIGNFGANLVGGWTIEAHITFTPAFSALNNKIFVRASNLAGFDSGYALAEVKR